MSAVRNFVITLLISLLIFGFVAYGILEFATDAFGLDSAGGNKKPSDIVGEDTEEVTPPITPPDEFDKLNGKSMTVLFVGTDYLPDIFNDYQYPDKRPDGFTGEVREIQTEVMILVRVNKETGECVFCPIPANTYIRIDGHTEELKSLYHKKGIEALREQITALTGLPIDYHAIVTIDGLTSIIDDLGGIDFYVPQDMVYSDPHLQLEINLREGAQRLDGKKALGMIRYPVEGDGSLRRRTATELLKALIKKVMNDVPINSAAVAYIKYQEYIETDLTIGLMTQNADLIFAFPKMAVKDYTYPGTVFENNGKTLFNPDTKKAMEFFSNYKFKG